jgi:glycosyltransferase involved in cell wall biosynthesis
VFPLTAMRYLFDCTTVFWNPAVNSGIQRVVRNIIANLPEATEASGNEYVPFVMTASEFYKVNSPIGCGKKRGLLVNLYCSLYRLRTRLWSHCEHSNTTFWYFSRSASRLACLALSCAMRILDAAGCSPLAECAASLVIKPGDHLVLLDSTWHDQYLSQVENLKARGHKVTAVIYDLIPLTRPEFVQHRLRDIYQKWFAWMAKHADGFACISRAVRDEVRAMVADQAGKERSESCRYSYFHLGSELDLRQGDGDPQSELVDVFDSPAPVFLIVGTLEPRKNHAYLIDAFDMLWQAGCKARLCLVGGIGWKCEKLVSRICSHPEKGGRLFWFGKLEDNGLEYAYRHADALIMSSHAEGFGLPIVEALQRGLPVMASDIPVFREIGSDFVAYFDLTNPQSLVDLVQAHELTRVIPGVRSPQEWRWIDWKDSSKQLINGVISGAD